MKAVGIILAGGNSERMMELSTKRAVAAMPLAGTYRSVDFALSNMSNSGINTVAVITQYISRSLNSHLSAPSWWGFGRKQGGLFLLNPTITPENSNWYLGTADALIQNLDFIKERHEPYVVIASGDCVYKIDYNKVLDAHVASGAEVTVVCKELEQVDPTRFGVLELDADQRIVAWNEKNEQASGHVISCGIYVIRRRHLISFLEECKLSGKVDFVRDILMANLARKKIVGYKLESYWNNIASVQSYFETNMDLLKPELRKHFFREYPAILTKVDDYPPAKFNDGGEMKNAVASGGCIVNGKVTDSVLFRKVYVGAGSVIRNCILLDDVYIGENVTLENCIVEEKTKIAEGTVIKGTPEDIKLLS